MRLVHVSMAGVVVVVLSVAGCSGGSDSSSASSSPSAAAAAVTPTPVKGLSTFVGRVSLEDYGPQCQNPNDPCWLPTQFSPMISTGETVSLRNTWPKQNDPITVVCTTKGQIYRDGAGQLHNDWYGVLIPSEKLEPSPGTDKKPVKPRGYEGYLAYVQASWISGGLDKRLAGCSLLVS